MKIDTYDFVTLFNHSSRAGQFSDAALEAIFNHFEEVDPDCEFDPIRFCCNFAEVTASELDEYSDITAKLSNGKYLCRND